MVKLLQKVSAANFKNLERNELEFGKVISIEFVDRTDGSLLLAPVFVRRFSTTFKMYYLM